MASQPTDVELMARVREGSQRAFAKLVDRHSRSVVNFFYRQLRDHHRAEDFAQEVFLRVFKAAATYVPQAKFQTFLFRIARNYLIDHQRARAVRPREYSIDAPGESAAPDAGSSSMLDRLPGPARAPSKGLDAREQRATIMRALEQLTEEQRLVFELAELQGLKYADVAEVAGIPVGTVKSRMYAATMKLKRLLVDLAPVTPPAGAVDSGRARGVSSRRRRNVRERNARASSGRERPVEPAGSSRRQALPAGAAPSERRASAGATVAGVASPGADPAPAGAAPSGSNGRLPVSPRITPASQRVPPATDPASAGGLSAPLSGEPEALSALPPQPESARSPAAAARRPSAGA